ncbi:uracil DNA glycosylase [Maublancomyces gigas]|uniref:Uracil DNA glycosylase n=1 Tax=Discina gigas TaxID=1032678 RepID=A0ABR3GJ65_9PEZI
MVLHSFEDNPASIVFTPPLTIWDTASHYCQITENCLDPDFLAYIKSPDNEFPELAGKVQVDATIALTGTTFSMSFLAFVVPAGTLPNNFKGVLLGQYTFLDQLHYEMIPRKVLHAFGTPIMEDLWGIIKIHTLLQTDGSIKRFADSRAEDKSLGEGEKASTFGTEFSGILREEGNERQSI